MPGPSLPPDEREGPFGEPEPRGRERRITIAGARRILGMIAKNYSDEDIQELLDILYGVAEVAYDDYLDSGSGDVDG